ncbi:restriction endonuclease subunit S [Shewanella sp.]|uniref:restriction endonuclease subunit S n=1 Tax=Shewanella sp. TaxID=50422 RepID=UPI004048CB08
MSRLLNAIEERQLLGINPDDDNNISEYLGYALNGRLAAHAKSKQQCTTNDVQIIVVPSLWITSTKHKRQLAPVFEQYALHAVIDVGAIWLPATSISFSLLVLGNEPVSAVLMADFAANAPDHSKSPVDRKLTPKADTSGELPNIVYSETFKQFLAQIEQTLFGAVSSEKNDQQEQQFQTFNVPANALDMSRLQVAFYHPDNQIDVNRYKNAKFEALEKLADVNMVHSVRRGDLVQGQVFKWSLLNTSKLSRLLPSKNDLSKHQPSKIELPITEGDATNQVLAEGDIIITPNCSKVFLVTKELNGVYAPAHNYHIRLKPNSAVSAQYLCLYLQSEFVQKYSLKMAFGSVIPRISSTDFKQLTILLPDDDTLSKSDELYQRLQTPETDLDKINNLLAGTQDQGRLQDSFLLEELEKLRISKRVIIEKLIKDDLKELKVCIDKGLYKSSMVICGSILEAIILDWLSETEKHDYYRDDSEISLSKAITLLKNLGELDYEAANAAHNIRTMRNLIHPRNYFKNQGKVTRKECMKLLVQLKLVIAAYHQS